MRRICCCLLFALAFANIALCQKDKVSYRPIIKLNIKSFADVLTFPTLQIGIEESISKRFSIYTEGGYQLYAIEPYQGDTSFIKNKGYKLSAEIRYYLLKRQKANLAAPYFALSFFHRYNQYNETLNYYPKDDPRPNYKNMLVDNFVVKKAVSGFNFIFGYQFNFKSKTPKYEITEKLPRIFMDIYAGVGSGNRITKNEHLEYDSVFHKRDSPIDVNVRGSFQASGLSENNGPSPSVIVGVRIGYRL